MNNIDPLSQNVPAKHPQRANEATSTEVPEGIASSEDQDKMTKASPPENREIGEKLQNGTDDDNAPVNNNTPTTPPKKFKESPTTEVSESFLPKDLGAGNDTLSNTMVLAKIKSQTEYKTIKENADLSTSEKDLLRDANLHEGESTGQIFKSKFKKWFKSNTILEKIGKILVSPFKAISLRMEASRLESALNSNTGPLRKIAKKLQSAYERLFPTPKSKPKPANAKVAVEKLKEKTSESLTKAKTALSKLREKLAGSLKRKFTKAQEDFNTKVETAKAEFKSTFTHITETLETVTDILKGETDITQYDEIMQSLSHISADYQVAVGEAIESVVTTLYDAAKDYKSGFDETLTDAKEKIGELTEFYASIEEKINNSKIEIVKTTIANINAEIQKNADNPSEIAHLKNDKRNADALLKELETPSVKPMFQDAINNIEYQEVLYDMQQNYMGALKEHSELQGKTVKIFKNLFTFADQHRFKEDEWTAEFNELRDLHKDLETKIAASPNGKNEGLKEALTELDSIMALHMSLPQKMGLKTPDLPTLETTSGPITPKEETGDFQKVLEEDKAFDTLTKTLNTQLDEAIETTNSKRRKSKLKSLKQQLGALIISERTDHLPKLQAAIEKDLKDPKHGTLKAIGPKFEKTFAEFAKRFPTRFSGTKESILISIESEAQKTMSLPVTLQDCWVNPDIKTIHLTLEDGHKLELPEPRLFGETSAIEAKFLIPERTPKSDQKTLLKLLNKSKLTKPESYSAFYSHILAETQKSRDLTATFIEDGQERKAQFSTKAIHQATETLVNIFNDEIQSISLATLEASPLAPDKDPSKMYKLQKTAFREQLGQIKEKTIKDMRMRFGEAMGSDIEKIYDEVQSAEEKKMAKRFYINYRALSKTMNLDSTKSYTLLEAKIQTLQKNLTALLRTMEVESGTAFEINDLAEMAELTHPISEHLLEEEKELMPKIITTLFTALRLDAHWSKTGGKDGIGQVALAEDFEKEFDAAITSAAKKLKGESGDLARKKDLVAMQVLEKVLTGIIKKTGIKDPLVINSIIANAKNQIAGALLYFTNEDDKEYILNKHFFPSPIQPKSDSPVKTAPKAEATAPTAAPTPQPKVRTLNNKMVSDYINQRLLFTDKGKPGIEVTSAIYENGRLDIQIKTVSKKGSKPIEDSNRIKKALKKLRFEGNKKPSKINEFITMLTKEYEEHQFRGEII